MNTRHEANSTYGVTSRLIVLLALVTLGVAPALAQTTGGTVISNQASATYSDGGGNNFSAVSNTVTVTVANVAGLAITPDAGSNPSVVPGQTSVDFSFTITNTSNFATQVRFLASGASVQVTGPATVQAAVIDVNNNGIGTGDTDISGNAADVLSASLARNASITVIVRVNVSGTAAAGDTVNVRLGDASTGSPTFDNQTANTSANEVRTSSGASAPAGGEAEARGDISATVQSDVQLRAVMNAPTGPVALGSDITYTLQLCNDGNRVASAITLGAFSGVYIIVPVPAGTTVSAANSFPAGTLYTNSLLTTAPLSATWSNAPTGTTTRIAFRVGATLADATCSSNFNFIVTVTTTDATTPIYAIADAFALNTVSATQTDQTGDTLTNRGDSNANFNEPKRGVPPAADDAASPTQGYQLPTTLQRVGNVLIGPAGQPAATGPTDQNDDYTNRSVTAGIAGVAPLGATTAGDTVDFTNTVRNMGNSNDVFTLTAPTVPTGFTVAISTNGTAGPFTTVSGGGSVTLPVSFGQQADIIVRVTAPAGQTVLTPFQTVIRATSANTAANSNDTIDRLYTGFLQLTKTALVINGTGVGGATDAVPGAVIEYSITYTNISSSGGTNNATLTVSSLVITENGNNAPNNWGTTTDQVVGSASDTLGGTITGDAAASTVLTDSVATLAPGQSGIFKFRRTIK
ncbi:MAG TPA: hypothetical protein VF708_04675 [Pyrinomonadaceae bacterium]